MSVGRNTAAEMQLKTFTDEGGGKKKKETLQIKYTGVRKHLYILA